LLLKTEHQLPITDIQQHMIHHRAYCQHLDKLRCLNAVLLERSSSSLHPKSS